MWNEIKAWYYRNYVYQDRLFNLEFLELEDCPPKIFELLAVEFPRACVYMGNGKFIEISGSEEFKKFIKQEKGNT